MNREQMAQKSLPTRLVYYFISKHEMIPRIFKSRSKWFIGNNKNNRLIYVNSKPKWFSMEIRVTNQYSYSTPESDPFSKTSQKRHITSIDINFTSTYKDEVNYYSMFLWKFHLSISFFNFIKIETDFTDIRVYLIDWDSGISNEVFHSWYAIRSTSTFFIHRLIFSVSNQSETYSQGQLFNIFAAFSWKKLQKPMMNCRIFLMN